MLGSLLLNVNDNASWKMDQSNCTVCSIHMLTTSPAQDNISIIVNTKVGGGGGGGGGGERQSCNSRKNANCHGYNSQDKQCVSEPYPEAFNVSILRSEALIFTSTYNRKSYTTELTVLYIAV